MIKAIIFDVSGVLHPFDKDLLAILRELKGKYRLAILSSLSGETLRHFLKENDIEDYFDEVISAYDLGHGKHEPTIYKLVAERLGIQPNEAIFIDDEAYRVDGAEAAGMQGIVYRGVAALKEALAQHVDINA